MTQASSSPADVVVASQAVAVPSTRSRALSPTLEFLLTGGATLALLPLAWWYQHAVGLYESELSVGFLMFCAAFVINDPHFSVTYLLFYRDVKRRAFDPAFPFSQRVRYWVAGALVPVGLAVWGLVAIAGNSARALGWMNELMFGLVGWHYVKQGFGVLSVLSARRGVTFTLAERRVVLAHCFAGWAYAWASPASPARAVEEKGVLYRAFPHPLWLEAVTLSAFLASATALLVILWMKYRRERRMLPPGPLAGFLITVWLWTVFTNIDPLLLYVIPALHSVQYLFFVWLLTRNQARAEEGPPSFGRPPAVRLAALALTALALGWFLFHGAPDLLDAGRARATDALGPTPYFAALFAFVNIHHYFMDHVIWRRENAELRHLRD